MSEGKKDESIGLLVFGLLMILLLLPAGIIVKAYVLVDLWNWFIVPLGVKTITTWHAYGLACLSHLLITHGLPITKFDKKESTFVTVGKIFSLVILAPLFAWGLGWVCHHQMASISL